MAAGEIGRSRGVAEAIAETGDIAVAERAGSGTRIALAVVAIPFGAGAAADGCSSPWRT